VDASGLGGSVKYVRIRANAAEYWPVGKGFIFSLQGEGGAIKSLASRNISGEDDVLLTDRFYLGEPQIRGFDIRGVGPRIVRKSQTGTNADGSPSYSYDRNDWTEDALGGRFYYLARAEMEIPLGAGAKEMGIRPSIFMDAGAVWGITHPNTQFYTTNQFIATRNSNGQALYSQTNLDGSTVQTTAAVNPQTNAANTALGQTVSPFQEFFYGDTPKPRISIGVGFNWNSPFGPFRIDIAKSLLHAVGDDTKTFTFNVGTQF
jgi:outer membrane protein insertion porin family